jgi:hypothetical protein
LFTSQNGGQPRKKSPTGARRPHTKSARKDEFGPNRHQFEQIFRMTELSAIFTSISDFFA